MKPFRTFFLPITVFIAAIVICLPLFQPGYTTHFSSIEPVYFAMAKFFREQFPRSAWVPEWYLGFPLRYLQNPLFISVLALANSLLSTVDISFAYRIICGLAYVLVPAVFYFFVQALTHKRPAASIASFSFILLPSLTYILPGMRNLASGFSYPPFTLLSFVYFGSGPRIVGLVLELVGLILVLGGIRGIGGIGGSPFDSLRSLSSTALGVSDRVSLRSSGLLKEYRIFLLGAVVAALVFLTDPVATTSFLILSVVLLLSEMMLEKPFQKLEKLFWLFVTAFGLSAFWFNPSYLGHLFFSPSLGGKPFKDLFLTLFNIAIIAIPLYLGFFATKFGRKKENQIWVILSLWLGIFGFLFGIYYLENPEFVSEYVKFVPEIDLGICLLIGLVGERIFYRVRSIGGMREIGIIGGLGILGILGIFWGRRWQLWLLPQHSLAGRPEYEVAKWLDKNVENGERVYVTGSPTFWLNALADASQVRGGSDVSAVHPWWTHASYQIREGGDPDLAVDWLKALGASYIVVHDDSSAEFYHDYKFPYKFESRSAGESVSPLDSAPFDFAQGLRRGLRKVYDNNRGDQVYKVDSESLIARVVDVSDAESLKTPKDGADSRAVGRYAKWRMGGQPASPNASQGGPASFEWLSNRKAAVRANLDEDQALSLAVSYDPGWRAFRVGDDTADRGDRKRILISRDPIGNIFINLASSDPGSSPTSEVSEDLTSEVKSGVEGGEVEIRLEYHNPFGVKVGYFITFAALMVLTTFPKYSRVFKKLKPRFFDFSFDNEQVDY